MFPAVALGSMYSDHFFAHLLMEGGTFWKREGGCQKIEENIFDMGVFGQNTTEVLTTNARTKVFHAWLTTGLLTHNIKMRFAGVSFN